MKAPWFPFYTGDFLASPDVQLMEAHEVGAYTLLLANSWQTDTPGYLTADEGRLRRICRFSVEQWADSRELLLSKWPMAENGMRHNPRLLREAGVQVARRDRLAANGAKGGRPPQKQKDTESEPTDNLQLSKNNLEVSKTEPTGLLSQPQPQSTNVDEEREQASSPAPALKAEKQHPAALHAENIGADLYSFAESFFAKPDVYAAVLRDIGFPEIDAAHYAREIGLAAADKGDRLMMSAWRKRLTSWLKNDKAKGCLLLATAQGVRASPDPEADRLRAAPRPVLAQPTAGYVPYVSKPNLPGTVAEPPAPYGPASTVRPF